MRSKKGVISRQHFQMYSGADNFILFFFGHPVASGVPEPGIRAELQVWPTLQLRQGQILNPLCWAKDRTCTSAPETLQIPLLVSNIHIYIYIYIYIYVCVCKCVYIHIVFFRFFSFIGHYEISSIVPYVGPCCLPILYIVTCIHYS